MTREALALCLNRKRVRNFSTHSVSPLLAKSSQRKRLCVQLLAGIAVKAVSAQKLTVLMPVGIDVFRNQITTWVANRFTLRALERSELAARVLDREVIH